MHGTLNAAFMAALSMQGPQTAMAEDDHRVVIVRGGTRNTGSITQSGAPNRLGTGADPAWHPCLLS